MMSTTPTIADLAGLLEKMQAQLEDFSHRLSILERLPGTDSVRLTAAPPETTQPKAASAQQEAGSGPTEDEVIAISAAIAAYLGVRAHIRQIRLVSSNVWAQQGRVWIQASHTLQT